MSILLKILIGILAFLVAVVLFVFVAYFIIVARHEHNWRKMKDEFYDEREKTIPKGK